MWEHNRAYLIEICNITSKYTFHKNLLEIYSNYHLEVQVEEEYISYKEGKWIKENNK